MAYIHSIAKLFEIKNPNIVLEDKVDTQLVKEVMCKVIFGTLSYQPDACQNCGAVNRSSEDLIKFGYKTSRIKLTTLGLQPVLLMLKKQRFQCQHCQTTFMATTPLVDERCFISNTLKQMITLELAEIQAMTLIAKRLNISPTPVSTQLKKAAKALNPSKQILPEHIGIDEFRSVGNRMSAIIPKELFMQVQEEIHRRSNIYTGEGKNKRIYSSKYALSTITFCGDCGDIYRRTYWNIHG